MPQEFLRDVLRTDDAPTGARRRLSVLPLSIAAHALAVCFFVLSPFLTGVDLPAISSPLHPPYMPTAAPPPSPPTPASPSRATATAALAPIEAPSAIVPETPAVSAEPVEGALPVGPGVAAGHSMLSDLNVAAPPMPPAPPQPLKPVPVGGAIREPKKILHIAPEYPALAQRARVQGMVILEATIDVTGKVDRLRVLRSEPLLDDAALRAVRQWRYTPTLLNGVPVPVLMTITVTFTLQ